CFSNDNILYFVLKKVEQFVRTSIILHVFTFLFQYLSADEINEVDNQKYSITACWEVFRDKNSKRNLWMESNVNHGIQLHPQSESLYALLFTVKVRFLQC